jgi:GT2 family glycosyltransferase
MKPDLVSVVVPTHNRADLLPRLLRSVLSQDHEDLELLVVDDGSHDDTAQVLAACTDPRLRVLHHERPRGVAEARNAGTRAARGRWLAWCDDDDVWAPAKLRLQLEALAAAGGALWCNGGQAYVDEQLRLSRVRRCPVPATVARDLLRYNSVTAGGSGVLADRELVLALGCFDTRLHMYADWDMWARLAHAAPLAVVDLPLVAYVEHTGGMSKGRLDLAFTELELLDASLERLATEAGLEERLDRRLLGLWMLRQQMGWGQRLDNLVMPFRLLRHGMMSPARAVGYGLSAALAPQALQRRWRRYWWLDEDYMCYAQSWLDRFRALDAAVD